VNEANKERKKKTSTTITKNREQEASPQIFFAKNGTTQDVNFIANQRECFGILFTAKKGRKTRWY
jgi:hypothetical protein